MIFLFCFLTFSLNLENKIASRAKNQGYHVILLIKVQKLPSKS
ncbi:hypothetical protein Cabys_190 [Caldithrix abyssi DSM 13497]|uniref:Uncharacterized protein n=1 Tax=Caldithrix abyssi DSM 13497 TaxID=880073 RepID=A0A1J1C2M4_CALAY|nr:hypothetical protein Cabys_190 [Caldithrix abyssi DSM 13497]